MPESRLEVFRRFLEKDPDNSFARYSLAMEYRGANDLEMALKTFEELLGRDPSYVAAYLMAGQVAVALDETEKARKILTKGIEAAKKAGNEHAVSKMNEILKSIA